MNEAEAIEIAREGVWVLLQMVLPLLVISLIVGVVISLFQALTQIQEQTITFAPKLVIMLISLIVLLPFMIQSLNSFTVKLFQRIITIG